MESNTFVRIINMKLLLLLLKWLARIASIISIGLMLIFFFGDHKPFPSITFSDIFLMLFFPLGVIAGMIVSWSKPGRGAMYSLFSLGAFYAIHYYEAGRFPEGPAFLIFALPSLIFLSYWFVSMNAFFREN
jgi:hypothetical protein